MPSLKGLSGKKIVSVLKKLGFVSIRQKGSHMILKKETNEGAIGCVVPMHKEVAEGTVRGVLRQAKVQAEDFLNLL